MSALFNSPSPTTPAAPTTVAAPPDRTGAETASLAARQKQRFTGAGSFTKNYLSGGAGTDGLSTTSRILGGTA